MNLGEWIFIAMAALTIGITVWGIASGSLRTPTKAQARRGGGNALLVVEEFVTPRIEHVITARQERTKEDAEAGEPPFGPIRFSPRADES